MIKSKDDLLEYLAADKRALGRIGKRPHFTDYIWKYEILLRKCEYLKNCKGSIMSRLVLDYYQWKRFHLGIKCNFSIPINTCGKGLSIAHIGPIIINSGAKIGQYCRIHVGVNIGTKAGYNDVAPKIGDFVYIGPGVKIYGDIEIADRIAIGANSVVNKSFLKSGIGIAGVYAKEINETGSYGIIKISE